MSTVEGFTTELKLVAIVLPEPVFSFVQDQQKFIKNTWGSAHALRTPPHITLLPPVKISSPELSIFQKALVDVASQNQKFTLSIDGYDAFSPRVVFLQPIVTEEMRKLHYDLRNSVSRVMPSSLARYPDRGFHPHITLAHRDVDKEMFREMWKHYKKERIKFSVIINEFHMLKHANDGWHIEECFTLMNEN